ncbi:unnamed protein product [Plutella xylostella]|uniref:(diamondback moth) hypothetical protein n=1 Tax=Plutella xylostella TaxID=51655 RepID=A0A8S4EUY6_PLUXY|nr:unnamed protein product [Plutella xylostella]
MKEREENEKEFECLLQKNTVLKNEMCEQDILYQDLQGKCDELNGLLRSYHQCQNIHEAALSQIHSLEQQLAEANGDLQRRNEEKERDENDKTIALYEELVNSQCKAVPTIDLTTPCKEPCEHKVTTKIIGANKRKKYCKINRFIKRSQHTVRKIQKSSHHHMKSINEENVRLGLLVHKYENEILVHRQELSECNTYYEMNMAMLQRRLVNLESALNSTRVPYSGDITTSPQMSASPEQPADSVLPTDAQLPPACPPADVHPTTTICNDESVVETSSVLPPDAQLPPACNLHENQPTTVCNDETAVQTTSPSPCDQPEIALSSTPRTGLLREAPYETIVFSDKLGSKMGHMLNDYLRQNVVNICMPGATFKQIVDRIISGQYSLNTTIVVLVGNSIDVKKEDLIQCYDALSDMNGDSGGPAQVLDGCAWRVVGVTSVGRACGAPRTPALYATVLREFVAAVITMY